MLCSDNGGSHSSDRNYLPVAIAQVNLTNMTLMERRQTPVHTAQRPLDQVHNQAKLAAGIGSQDSSHSQGSTGQTGRAQGCRGSGNVPGMI